MPAAINDPTRKLPELDVFPRGAIVCSGMTAHLLPVVFLM
jgi:hypothetical protein